MIEETLQPEKWLGNFGLKEFRPGQKNVIDTVLAGRDTLCIMPTGGGKSLCYQLPTIAREGVTIVISPLIALMKDQVDALQAREIPATFINSSLTLEQQQTRIHGMTDGQYKLVYIAPERLRSNSFMRAVGKTQIQLLAVDEAHCISQWGHDFRPDYARLGRLREKLGNPQTIALTATATSFVQGDIVKILQLQKPAKFVTGFARSNLNQTVQSPNSNVVKDNQLIDFLNTRPGCGIIYASTRKNCEHLVELLQDKVKRSIAFYHAGLTPDWRRKVQERFMSGEIEIIVATNAFGMGIDKSDLRFVVHYNLPGSIEAYYQEAGRAGRDGKPSQCLMLYSFQDKFIQEFFIENSYPSRAVIKEVYEYLCTLPGEPIETTLQEIKDELDLSIGTSGIGTCANLLEKAGAIERLDSKQNSAAIKIDSDLPTLIDFLPRDSRSQRHVLKGLEQLVGSFRNERVMFQTKHLAERLDMKWDAVNRAIKQLVKLPMIDYIPPFRGRAIHITDRNKPFNELNIDFSELSRRKEAEHEKLQTVIRFATTQRCRQLEILEYFGDPDRDLCGNCDNCSSQAKIPVGTARNSNSDACMYAAQVALSGTARTHGRIGKNLIAQMLTGSSSKKVKQMGLSKLSTFGLLSPLRQSDVIELMEFLIQQGYIEQVSATKFRPTTKISPSGKRLMAGLIAPDLTAMMPSKLVNQLSRVLRGKTPHLAQPNPTPAESEPDPADAESQIDNVAEESDSDPDETETHCAPAQDQHREEAVEFSENSHSTGATDSGFSGRVSVTDLFAKLSDTDESSADQASQDHDFPVENVEPLEHKKLNESDPADFQATDNSTAQVDDFEDNAEPESAEPDGRSGQPLSSKRIRLDLPEPTVTKPNYFWTWRLLADGYTKSHLRQVRQLDEETIFSHAIVAIENELPAQQNWLLDDQKIQTIESFVNDNPNQKTSELLSKIPTQLKPHELIFYLKCQNSS